MSIAEPEAESTPRDRHLFRVNPMAHLAIVVLVLGVLGPITARPAWFFWLAALPVAFAWWVARTRTRVDEEGVHLRSWRTSRDVPWSEVKGVVFPGRGFARLVTTTEGDSPRMGGVSFHDLPRLSRASRGRITDPFAAARRAERDAREAERTTPEAERTAPVAGSATSPSISPDDPHATPS